MARVYNFSAGPSMLPEEVLKTAAAEMLEYGETGQSVMEMSHRAKCYYAIIKILICHHKMQHIHTSLRFCETSIWQHLPV